MSLSLPTPAEFSAFPYDPPYSIQVDLMRHVYATIEDRKISIVESPTGTGKTLSLLCASLTWLMDDKTRALKGRLSALQESSTTSCNDPDWVLAQTMERHKRELLEAEADFERHLGKARQKEAALRKIEKARVRKKPRLSSCLPAGTRQELDDDVFLPDDFGTSSEPLENSNLSPAVLDIMKKLEQTRTRGPEISRSDDILRRTKIFYTSRTHSQLSQVMSELEKLKLVPTLSDSVSSSRLQLMAEESHSTKKTAAVALASRRHLCINEELRGRSGNLDDGCRELLTEQHSKRCPFLPPSDEESRMMDFRDRILATPKDIEDLVEAGKSTKVCPYFGSRYAIPLAELVVLPYNYLMQSNAREALDIDLTDQVLIIDEAHNLNETLLQLHSAHLTLSVLRASRHQLGGYLKKFRNKLSAVHLLHIKRLFHFINALEQYATIWKTSASEKDGRTEEVTNILGFIERLGSHTEGINLLEIHAYMKKSKIARKISRFNEQFVQESGDDHTAKKGVDLPLHVVESFIVALTNAQDDGCLIISWTATSTHGEVIFKYQHLNPSTYFDSIVAAARSVILAGGTMSPISDVTLQLLPQLSPSKLTTFSCDHVIPASNLQCLVIGRGPSGKHLELKYTQRNDENVVREIGQIISNLANIVPHGIVVFFPSYAFLDSVKALWTRNGLLARLEQKKRVFFEPHENSTVDKVLSQYHQAIFVKKTDTGKGGALLFAVVGAKLSEGLNFSDELARAVVIVGLPFANLGSKELKTRMEYVKRHAGPPSSGIDAGMEFYENICMKAVNQSIGRAIRHQSDWSSLILIDRRYSHQRIQSKLPQWIRQSLTVTDDFGQAARALGQFYRSKK